MDIRPFRSYQDLDQSEYEPLEDSSRSLTDLIQYVNRISSESSILKQNNFSYLATIYTELINKYSARTLGDALDLITQRKIDSKIIGIWIDSCSAFALNNYLELKRVYPEHKEKLEKLVHSH